MTYKRVLVPRFGGADILTIVEEEVTKPRATEVRIKVLAAGISFADVLVREGLHPVRPRPPFTPGWDVVGVVDELGAGVSGLTLGQMIAALPVIGGYAETICLPAAELIPVPEGVDPCEAVCLVLNYMTAYQMLHRSAHVKFGESILIHGAAGGVGTALLQLGQLAGLKMYGTASSQKHELIKRYGATPIDYRKEDFVERIHTLTEKGVDAVFDGIGGAQLRRSYQALRRNGRLIVFGHAANLVYKARNPLITLSTLLNTAAIFLWSLNIEQKRVKLYSIQTLKKQHPEWFREDLSKLLKLLAAGEIKPIIAECLSLDEVARAHKMLESASVKGKLVLQYGLF